MNIKKFKSDLKALAAQIKEDSAKVKECQRGNSKWEDYYAWRKSSGILYVNLSDQYRHNHIAYCLLRGTKYSAIESKVRIGNEPNWTRVEIIMKEYREVDEIACSEVMNG